MIKANLSKIKKYVNEIGINELDVNEKLSSLDNNEFLNFLSTFDCVSDFIYRTAFHENNCLVVNVKTSIGSFNPFEVSSELKELVDGYIDKISSGSEVYQMEYDSIKECYEGVIDGEMTVAGNSGGYWGFKNFNPNSAFEPLPEKELKNKLVEVLFERFSNSSYNDQSDFEYDMNEFIMYEINGNSDIDTVLDYAKINPKFEETMIQFSKDCKQIVEYYENYETLAKDFLSNEYPDKLEEYNKEVFLSKINSLDLKSGLRSNDFEINNKKYHILIDINLEKDPTVNVTVLVNNKPLQENSRIKFNGVLLKDYANINYENSKNNIDKFLDVQKLKRFINGVQLIQNRGLDKTTEIKKLFSIKDISKPNNIDWTINANKNYLIDSKNNLKISYETIAKNNITNEDFKIKDLSILTKDLNKLIDKIMPNQIDIAANLIKKLNKDNEFICSGNNSSIEYTSNDFFITGADQSFAATALNGVFKNEGFRSKDQVILEPKVMKQDEIDI